MENNEPNIPGLIKAELGRLFITSFVVFLFILFFQPIPLEFLQYDNRLLFVIGFGLIILIFLCVFLIIIPLLLPKWFVLNEWENGPPFLLSFIFLVFTSTAFVFYSRYVGKVPASFYLGFKIVLISGIPLFILFIINRNKLLKHRIQILENQNKICFTKLQELETSKAEEKIKLYSENKSDVLHVKFNEIVAIKSADNYIEVFFVKNDTFEKKLLRNSLKNIELQLQKKKNFIRCHRTSIVNQHYIEKLEREFGNYKLVISGLDENIPVSRQYLVQVREVISTMK